MNFSLCILIQNSIFLKKANNSTKNNARVINDGSNNRYFFDAPVCNANSEILLLKYFQNPQKLIFTFSRFSQYFW